MDASQPAPVLPPEADPLFPEGTVDAGIYRTRRSGFAHSLVVLAMGEACWLVASEKGWHLRVKENALAAVHEQLRRYDQESVGWPPKASVAEDAPAHARRLPLSPLVWALSVLAVFAWQMRDPSLTNAWSLDAERVFRHGEWWRPFTALWLHADAGHLVANLCSGLWVVFAVLLTFGVRAGWGLLALASVGGNLLALAAHARSEYHSIGASTGVFAALGLLVAQAIARVWRGSERRPWKAMWIPLFSGFVILGLMGAGEEHVDVLAHGTGFCMGVVVGLLGGRCGSRGSPGAV